MSSIGSDPISSTEVRAGPAPSWTTVAPLPLALSGLRGVTIDNSFYVTGAAGSLHVDCILLQEAQLALLLLTLRAQCTFGAGLNGC